MNIITKLVGSGVLALLLAAACGGKETQAGGSNTNWFATCNVTSQCGSGFLCWCGICTKACATDCADSAAADTCTEPPAACADPSKGPACAVGCTKDADCKKIGADAACTGGVCSHPNTSVSYDAGGGTLTCDQRTGQAVDALAPLEKNADLSCKTTADCVEFPSVSCTNGCSKGLISKTGLASIQGSIARIETSVCAPFKDAGCTVIEPPCLPPGTPACVAGKCTDQLGAPPVDSGATASCDARLMQIGDRLTAALDMADTSCATDDDCERISAGDSCYGGCPTYLVSKAGNAAFGIVRKEVQNDLCDSYLADGCMPARFGCPNIPASPPVCVDGACAAFPLIDSGPPPSTCDDRTAKMKGQLQPVVDTADKKCSADKDCQVVMLVDDCLESCTYAPTSATGAQTIKSELSTIDAGSDCKAFKDAGCTVPRLPCVAPPTPKCNAGACENP